MSGALMNLEARPLVSQVLGEFIASRPGAAHRAGLMNATDSTQVMSSDLDGMRRLFAPINSASGFAVTDRTAMQVSTVFACLSKLAGSITQLPIHHYRVDADGERKRMPKEALWWMLNESPSPAWTAASWKEWLVRCWGLRGDQYTEIQRRGAVITGLKPLHPDYVQVRRQGDRLVYDVMDIYSGVGDGTGKIRGVDQDDMLHFTGFGFDGLSSISPIQHAAKQAVGNSLAATDFSGRTLGQGAMPKLALMYPNRMSPDQAQLLRTNFVATYGGGEAQKMPLVLTENAQVKQLSLSPVDLQLLDQRKMERDQIAETFGVPAIIIGNNDKSSAWGSGIEQIILGFVRFTIKPHLARWEEELNRKLFRRAGQFVEFELDGLLSGDSKAQSDAFRAALGGPGTGDAWMTVNQVRKLKNMPAIDGGDVLFKAQTGTTAPAPAGA